MLRITQAGDLTVTGKFTSSGYNTTIQNTDAAPSGWTVNFRAWDAMFASIKLKGSIVYPDGSQQSSALPNCTAGQTPVSNGSGGYTCPLPPITIPVDNWNGVNGRKYYYELAGANQICRENGRTGASAMGDRGSGCNSCHYIAWNGSSWYDRGWNCNSCHGISYVTCY